ncbi:unnamed protein product [Dibothriocephalus latus]|uniref:G-protein coupled receptors family 1 profile domain-containing protein n=1 Tax=Dibothriocephalus latus TaxID=60516 RepID=A0A3P7LGT8_DIBLA|nr:unnamed protein product [Dibothriocephalus latus]
MSQVYWICPTSLPPRDSVYVLRMIILPVGLLANTSTFVLLCRLSGRTRTSLTMLRSLIFAGAVRTFLELFRQQPSLAMPSFTSDTLGAGVCVVWESGFLTVAINLFDSLVLVFVVSYRATQIAFKYQYSFSSSAYIDLVCASCLCLACFLCAVPQCFVVAWREGQCECLDRNMPYGKLLLIYAGSFVKYGIDIFINAPLLTISSVQIILWVRSTPPAKLIDTLNSLAFSGTSESLRREFEQPQGWWTASMCMVVLSVNFLLLTAYSTVQKMFSVSGVFLLDDNSYWTRFGDCLMLLHVTTAPFIVMIYIPALRHQMKSFYRKIAAGFRFRRQTVPSLLTLPK